MFFTFRELLILRLWAFLVLDLGLLGFWDLGIWCFELFGILGFEKSVFFVLLGNSGVLDFRICGCWGFLEFGNFGDAGFGVLGFGLSRVWDVGILGFEIWGFGDLELWVLLVLEVCGFWDFYSGVFV